MPWLFRDERGAWLYPNWGPSCFGRARKLFVNLGGFAAILWATYEIALFVRHNLIQSDIAGPWLYVLALVFAAAWFIISAATTNPAGNREFLLTNIWGSEFVAVQLGLIIVAVGLIREGLDIVSAAQHPLRWTLSLACAAAATVIAYFDRGALLVDKKNPQIDVARARGWMTQNVLTFVMYVLGVIWVWGGGANFDTGIGIASLAVLLLNLTIAVVFATFVADHDAGDQVAPSVPTTAVPSVIQHVSAPPSERTVVESPEPRSPIIREADYPRYRHTSD
jgi:hypothetical protein